MAGATTGNQPGGIYRLFATPCIPKPYAAFLPSIMRRHLVDRGDAQRMRNLSDMDPERPDSWSRAPSQRASNSPKGKRDLEGTQLKPMFPLNPVRLSMGTSMWIPGSPCLPDPIRHSRNTLDGTGNGEAGHEETSSGRHHFQRWIGRPAAS